MISSYFDESSENDSQNGILGVSGYSVDAKTEPTLNLHWRRMLEKYRIPYFHMQECNAENGIYDHLSAEDCDRCAREAIELARKYTLHGHAAVINQSVYRRLMLDKGFDCDPYTFLVWVSFIHVSRWVNENRPDEEISLFFEEGYKSQKRAQELLDASATSSMGGRNRVVEHSFLSKHATEAIQASDLIAWHIRKGYENLSVGKKVRQDTKALFDGVKVFTLEFDENLILHLRDQFIERAGSLEIASRALFLCFPDGVSGIK